MNPTVDAWTSDECYEPENQQTNNIDDGCPTETVAPVDDGCPTETPRAPRKQVYRQETSDACNAERPERPTLEN